MIQQIIDSAYTKNKSDCYKILSLLSLYCQDILMLDSIAKKQHDLKAYSDCEVTLQKMISISNNQNEIISALTNLAKVYNHNNKPSLSLEVSEKILESDPNNFGIVMEKAFSKYLMGNYPESESIMRSLYQRNDLPEIVKKRIEYNLGTYDLENGDFKKGLAGFIGVGHEIGIWKDDPREQLPVPKWNGEIIPGSTIVIHSEGGIGDEIINVRFINNIKDLGMNAIWVTHHEQLHEVFNRNGYTTVKSSKDIEVSDNMFQCHAMFLPILLGIEGDAIPNGSYLKPCPLHIEKWKKILPAGKKLALKFSGNPAYEQDLHRSIPIEKIKSLDYYGTIVNLQLEPEFDQEDWFNCSDKINSIEDTLAILHICDDVVSSCTSVAHMFGAIGKPGIVCPPIACYYVWLGNFVWYKNTTVIRQKVHNDWSIVISKVKQLLGT